MKRKYEHGSLNLDQKTAIIFTSLSKHNFFLRSTVTQFVLLQGCTPINPFMNVDYNLNGLVNKDTIRIANNTMISRCDEVWVFGDVSDGVLTEIYLAGQHHKMVRYFIPTADSTSFREITADNVRLEDVSPWMWDWVRAGKDLGRWHPRLRFKKTYPLVYPAYSKYNFFLQMHISQFCLENRVVPLNPFMLFRYFLGDSAPRETIYRGNNNVVRICDEVWSFGEISDGVLAEIQMKRAQQAPVRYYKVVKGYPVRFRQIPSKAAEFEQPELEEFRYILD